MRKVLIVLCSILVLAVILCGCDSTAEEEAAPELLPFPGISWGMTPEELTAALALEEDSYVQKIPEAGENGYWTIREIYRDAFGAEACLGFQFQDENGDGTYGLCRVSVVYPQDTDMESVRNAMEDIYGEPSETNGTARVYWNSALLCREIMSEQDLEYLTENSGTGGEEAMESPVTKIQLQTDYRFGATYQAEKTTNVIFLESSYSYYAMEGGYTGK